MKFTFQESFQEVRKRHHVTCHCFLRGLFRDNGSHLYHELDDAAAPTSHEDTCPVHELYQEWLAHGRQQYDLWREDMKHVQVRI